MMSEDPSTRRPRHTHQKGRHHPHHHHPRHRMRLEKPVFLIGFMGAGKTSVARRLARHYGVSSVDLDSYIERKQAKRISDIFAEEGEDAFRDLETEYLRQVIDELGPMVVSCGGGIVERKANCELMSDAGLVVHLEVDADEASKRISDKSSRPLFANLESARERSLRRLPLYEDAAHVTISTFGKTPIEVSRELSEILREEGILCPR